ncbi:MAG TPA: hypothetical protein DET40_22020 [Lentisphaeria bacterium]|nr:MAG: hypothetical protein A2X45_04110 [Lentisphaerae bacterium GWF2_50_93]HCE46231.1 hypothetical protein [Lentisphaeria bacterium]
MNIEKLAKSAASFAMITGICNVLFSQEPTIIEIKDEIKVKDVSRLGINIGDDNYYSSPMLKMRAVKNFEGTSYRQCHRGSYQDANGATTFYAPSKDKGWENIYRGADFTILSGPAKGQKGRIKDVSKKLVPHEWKKGETQECVYFEFEKPLTMPADKPVWNEAGILVEKIISDEGSFPSSKGYWLGKNSVLAAGDIPPGSFGRNSCLLAGTGQKEDGFIRLSTQYQRIGETNGIWHLRFWSKIKDGSPSLEVSPSFGPGVKAELAKEWKQQEMKIKVDKVPEAKNEKDEPHLTFVMQAKNGSVLVDDIELWMEGDSNPTPFRDDAVNILKRLNPGCIRFLQMGGNTMDNVLQPPLRRMCGTNNIWEKAGLETGRNPIDYGVNDILLLAEHIGSDAWYCVPGTLDIEEIDKLMEFLGAPAEVGYGKIRAASGHPKPWTESGMKINIEIGNEAWNTFGPFMAGGYNGPDYWNDIFSRAKKSPYYKPNIIFHAAGQNVQSEMSAKILKSTPAADRYAVAPYILHSLEPEDLEALGTDEKLFPWLYAYGISYIKRGMAKQGEVSKKTGIEFSVYEINHHITGGKAPLEPRNRMVTSVGGSLNVINGMLLLLHDYGIRNLNFFTLTQKEYGAPGVGNVRLWGAVLSQKKGAERFRPTFLALEIANRVIMGDMLETVQGGANPIFSSEGKTFPGFKKGELNRLEYPKIWSYAFSEGKKKGLILVNLDTSSTQPVQLKFSGSAADVKSWLLTADKISDGNEFEVGDPKVKVQDKELKDFKSGAVMSLPPFSMQVFKW